MILLTCCCTICLHKAILVSHINNDYVQVIMQMFIPLLLYIKHFNFLCGKLFWICGFSKEPVLYCCITIVFIFYLNTFNDITSNNFQYILLLLHNIASQYLIIVLLHLLFFVVCMSKLPFCARIFNYGYIIPKRILFYTYCLFSRLNKYHIKYKRWQVVIKFFFKYRQLQQLQKILVFFYIHV